MATDTDADEPEHRFAPYLRTLGRGPGRSRALTREEARDALRMVLRDEVEPLQIGAFLLLLRYRGEDVNEIAGLTEAPQPAASRSISTGQATAPGAPVASPGSCSRRWRCRRRGTAW